MRNTAPPIPHFHWSTAVIRIKDLDETQQTQAIQNYKTDMQDKKAGHQYKHRNSPINSNN